MQLINGAVPDTFSDGLARGRSSMASVPMERKVAGPADRHGRGHVGDCAMRGFGAAIRESLMDGCWKQVRKRAVESGNTHALVIPGGAVPSNTKKARQG